MIAHLVKVIELLAKVSEGSAHLVSSIYNERRLYIRKQPNIEFPYLTALNMKLLPEYTCQMTADCCVGIH